jgi:cold shock CspA family protein
MILGAKRMATGTVKSFNRIKGYGFIRTDSGEEVFVHLSAVKKAGLIDLKKGQKLSFEIFENHGKPVAEKLASNIEKSESVSSPKLVMMEDQDFGDTRIKAKQEKGREQSRSKRTSISRGELESTIAEAVRSSGPECAALVGVIVERVVPESSGDANWVVKGVKYGKAERVRCAASLLKCVEEGQRAYEIVD